MRKIIFLLALAIGIGVHEGFHIIFTWMTGGSFKSFVVGEGVLIGIRTTYPINHWIWNSNIFLLEEIGAYILTMMTFIVSFRRIKCVSY